MAKYTIYRRKPKVLQQKRFKKQKVLKVSKKRVNNRKSVKLDKKYKALPAGKRRSKSGKKYWETRTNRSDLKGRNKLV